jgi:hypothetical protein
MFDFTLFNFSFYVKYKVENMGGGERNVSFAVGFHSHNKS